MLRGAIKRPFCCWYQNVQASRLASFSTTRLAPQLALSVRRPIGTKDLCLRIENQQRLFSTSEKDQNPRDSPEEPILSDAWVSMLENTVSSPWLPTRPPTPERILERSFMLILQILLALNIPREPEVAKAFFFAFEHAPVSSTSEMGRGRRAIGILTRTIVDDISSIPMSSPLRQQHAKLFALHNALVPLCDMHLRGPSDNIEDWKAFWSRAEGPLFQLDTELDNAGFGLDLETLMEAQKEEAANQKNASKSEGEIKQPQNSPIAEEAKK